MGCGRWGRGCHAAPVSLVGSRSVEAGGVMSRRYARLAAVEKASGAVRLP